jgi:hypothetical protein
MPAHLKFFYGPMDCGKSALPDAGSTASSSTRFEWSSTARWFVK